MTISSPGLDLADPAGADGGQGGVLAGDDPAAREPAQDQRADALRVARGVHGVLVHPDEREGALELREHLERALLEGGVGVVREQRGDQAGVVGGALLRLAQVEVEPSCSLGSASTIASSSWVLIRLPLWPSAMEPPWLARNVGCAFFQELEPRGGVAAVADRDVADQAGERRLVEDLGDQAHVLVDEDLPAVADRDAGRLLAAVLEGVETEVRSASRRPHPAPRHRTRHRRPGALVLGVEGQRQPSVAAPPCR